MVWYDIGIDYDYIYLSKQRPESMHYNGKQNYNIKYFTVCLFVLPFFICFCHSILRFLVQELPIEFHNK